MTTARVSGLLTGGTMAKNATSFGPKNKANLSGRAPLTDAQRIARDMRAQCQPELIERLLRVVRESDDNKDVVAAAKALLEEMPLEVRDVTERSLSWVDKLTFEQAVAIARLTAGK